MKAPTMIPTLALVCLLGAAYLALAQTTTKHSPHTNHLAGETSPYLLQHAHNPVDWYPWGAEAFEKARREDKPVFLSVGYSTCHWCHVMAHESFEDEEVARVMNELFVCIKVDREELPDVDEQYMLATQLMTQRGGWPNSVVLTPDRHPWFAGTYYPKDRFIPLLKELARAWKEQRPQVEEQANRLSAAIRQVGAGRSDTTRTPPLSPQVIDRAIEEYRSLYDARNGGFGSRPKFPPHGILSVMLDAQPRTRELDDLSIITHTLDAMRLGGIYDHVGGGFHRYSTDSRWFVPHFEKMLYDNAQLIRAYTNAFRLTGDEAYKQVVAQTFAWLTREMTDPAGGFYCAIDADSEGQEGKFYVWTYQEIEDTLGHEDAKLFTETYNITREGNYHEEATGHPTGANIPHLTHPLPDDAPTPARLDAARARLLDHRNKRIHPHLDDKVLTGWNGLMIAALAQAGRDLAEPRYTQAASAAADFILRNVRTPDGRLHRSWRKGQAKLPAYLDDYAFLIDALLELHTSAKDPRYLDAARSLTQTMIADFHDDRSGGFFSTSNAHHDLLVRTKEVGSGGNIPSGNGVAANALLGLAIVTGEDRYADLAAGTLRNLSSMMWSQPHGAEALILAASRYYAAAERYPKLKLAQRLSTSKTSDADATAGKPPVTIEAYASQLQAAPGSTIELALRIHIDEGYHIYAPGIDPQTMLIPVSATVESSSPLRLGTPRWPEPLKTTDPILKSQILTYEGAVLVLLPLQVSADAPEGKADLKLRFKAQACDDKACYPPADYSLTIPLTITKSPMAIQPRHREVFEQLRGRQAPTTTSGPGSPG